MIALLLACGGYPLDDTLRLNHLQAEGTHNSYHVQGELPREEFAYTHQPLDVQAAELGVRQYELDINWDAEQQLFRVHHVWMLDEQTTCPRLEDCLGALWGWSEANPGHHPICVHVEPKDTWDGVDVPGGFWPEVQAEIAAAWPTERILRPDVVQGDAATLREAVTGAGWPTLGEVRGHAMFVLLGGGDMRQGYLDTVAPADRLLFVEASSDDDPDGAVYRVDDPIAEGARIAELVGAGFVVRTRADTDGVEARANDTTRLDAALASGATWISTDFPGPVEGIAYEVAMPGGTPSRCNPLTAPPGCTSEDVESPKRLR